jgi:hypothetical protein
MKNAFNSLEKDERIIIKNYGNGDVYNAEFIQIKDNRLYFINTDYPKVSEFSVILNQNIGLIRISIEGKKVTSITKAIAQASLFASYNDNTEYGEKLKKYWTILYKQLMAAKYIAENLVDRKDLTAVIFYTDSHTREDIHTKAYSYEGINFYVKIWSPEHKDSTDYAISYTLFPGEIS